MHMAQLMPLPLTVSCFSKIQIGFTFLVPAYPGSPGQRAVKRVCVCYDINSPECNWFGPFTKVQDKLAKANLKNTMMSGAGMLMLGCAAEIHQQVSCLFASSAADQLPISRFCPVILHLLLTMN